MNPIAPAAGLPPQVLNIVAIPGVVPYGGAAAVEVMAATPTGDDLAYTYTADHGQVLGTGSSVTYVNDGQTSVPYDSVHVVVSDRGTRTASAVGIGLGPNPVPIGVNPFPTQGPSPSPSVGPPQATPTPSSPTPNPSPNPTPSPSPAPPPSAPPPPSPSPSPADAPVVTGGTTIHLTGSQYAITLRGHVVDPGGVPVECAWQTSGQACRFTNVDPTVPNPSIVVVTPSDGELCTATLACINFQGARGSTTWFVNHE